MSLRRLSHNGIFILFGLVHIVDKQNYDDRHQQSQIELLSREIRTEETAFNQNTILVGDFNINPFDFSMNAATGLNAMPTKRSAKKTSRTVQGVPYNYFYNPMWEFLGDRGLDPSGTFYHTGSTKGHYGWNVLDQVLIRPNLLHLFGEVNILTTIGPKKLHTSEGRPSKSKYSDHFPILLKLK